MGRLISLTKSSETDPNMNIKATYRIHLKVPPVIIISCPDCGNLFSIPYSEVNENGETYKMVNCPMYCKFSNFLHFKKFNY